MLDYSWSGFGCDIGDYVLLHEVKSLNRLFKNISLILNCTESIIIFLVFSVGAKCGVLFIEIFSGFLMYGHWLLENIQNRS